MISLHSPALATRPLRLMLGTWLIVLACAAFAQSAAAAKSSDRPRVKADASLIKGLVKTPLPNYPAIAAKQGWGGLGVFELQFQPDGTVRNVVTLLTTGHPLLDDSARASLRQWRCQPGVQRSGRLTISFSTKQHPVELEPEGDEVRKISRCTPRPPTRMRRAGVAGLALVCSSCVSAPTAASRTWWR
ncbi:MAG: energy transducer TonB [Chthoniobacterales bacterium]|nr:energy transducer TonB [Chthoniobacterales bacterium]